MTTTTNLLGQYEKVKVNRKKGKNGKIRKRINKGRGQEKGKQEERKKQEKGKQEEIGKMGKLMDMNTTLAKRLVQRQHQR